MRRRVACSAFAALAFSAAFASACGSKTTLGSILSPTEGATLTSLTISMTTPPVGGTVQATAVAMFSTGGSAIVTTGFTSDTPGVATTTPAGLVTGVAIGDVTISVDYSGKRATKKVHVLPSYAGYFHGTYVVSACTQTDGFATENFCASYPSGTNLSIEFSHDQSADLATLTGQFRLFPLVGDGVGLVSPSGALSYTGAFVTGTRRMDFRKWAGTSPAPGHIIGSFEMVWTDSAVTGQAVMTATNMDMIR
jgi:hypothetical protein